ncbi:lipase family protein [Rickettsia endosymbiont of Halotydeus destructor]|uniref:lipase family protein n=1 Tax=Rickettsia endosymbiont of Halotydeus destructor TaxID=2996754 RepID=UPI003BAE9C92
MEDMELLSLSEIPNRDVSSNELAHAATNLAYNSANPTKYLAKALEIVGKELIGSGWEIFATSSEKAETSEYGYKAVAFINKQSKEIHIASAGTKADIYDLLDDIRLTFHYAPNKLAPAQKFIDEIIARISQEEVAHDYIFSTSGHSLGAVVADLTALELHSRKLNIDKSTTFDSPGSAEVVKYAIQNKLFTGEINISIEELAKHSVVYNAKPNIINTTNNHLGEVNLTLPQVKNNVVEEQTQEESSGLWGWGQYLYNTVGSAVQVSADYLGITNTIEQLNGHKLHNFAAVDNNPVYSVEAWSKNELFLKSNKTNLDLTKKIEKSTGTDVFLIDDTYDNDYVNINAYSYSDLQNCAMEVSPIGDLNNNLVSVY